MKYHIAQLIDVGGLQDLMQSLFEATGIVHALLDSDGNVISAAGWNDICTEYHRAHPETCARCRQSDQYIAEHLHDGPYVGYVCANGLYDYATPIIIEGTHVASIFTGQILHETADVAFFRRQAAQFGFDEESYLTAVGQVRVVPKEKMPAIMKFLCDQARMLATMGLARLRQLETAEELASLSEQLRRSNQELNRATQAKARLFAAASHDLRQPLQGLNLYLELLNQPAHDHGALARARECAEALSAQIDDLFDIAKLDSPELRVRPDDHRLDEIVSKAVRNAELAAKIKGLELRQLPSNAVVRTDAFFLERLVSNLLSNAVKYTEKGGILVGCRRSQSGLRLQVWDTGIGMPEEALPYIFEEFHQLGNSSRDRSKGSGLGLAIVERLAKLLQLRISVRSKVGRGSVFSVEFPDRRA